MAGLPGIERSSPADFKIKREKFTWLEKQPDGKGTLRSSLKTLAQLLQRHGFNESGKGAV